MECLICGNTEKFYQEIDVQSREFLDSEGNVVETEECDSQSVGKPRCYKCDEEID